MGKRRYAKPEITVLIAEPEGDVTEHGHDRNNIDANGLPMVAEHSRAAYLGCYTVHATMYMDIPDPITENENNQSK